MFVTVFHEHRDSSVHETSTGLSGAGWCGELLLVVTASKPSFATDLAHICLIPSRNFPLFGGLYRNCIRSATAATPTNPSWHWPSLSSGSQLHTRAAVHGGGVVISLRLPRRIRL